VARERDGGAVAAGGIAGHSAGDSGGSAQIKELERDLRRKEKALAETAALLVLSKTLRRSSKKAGTNDF
jgi:hypothetical protein